MSKSVSDCTPILSLNKEGLCETVTSTYFSLSFTGLEFI